MRAPTRLAAAAAVAAIALLAAACGGNGDGAGATTTTGEATTTTSAATTTSAPDEEPRAVSVYFLDGEALMVGEGRDAETAGVVDEALSALVAGPSDFETEVGLHSEIPEGTELLGVDLDEGVARVDLSDEFESGGGSQSMQARVAQVVYTATQFDEVDSVRFLVDGQEVDAIGGEGVVVAEPLGREDFEFGGDFGDASLLPPVLVETPRLGEEIESPVRITGSANVFEAVFQVEIVQGEGVVVGEETVTASSGTGQRGTFDAAVDFEPVTTGLGAIVTFVESARDGSRQNVREVPVQMG